MWHSLSDHDILDFALLWEPLGGASPENVEAAFSIEFTEYTHRLRAAARLQVARLQDGVTSPDHIYGLSALAALDLGQSNRSSHERPAPP